MHVGSSCLHCSFTVRLLSVYHSFLILCPSFIFHSFSFCHSFIIHSSLIHHSSFVHHLFIIHSSFICFSLIILLSSIQYLLSHHALWIMCVTSLYLINANPSTYRKSCLSAQVSICFKIFSFTNFPVLIPLWNSLAALGTPHVQKFQWCTRTPMVSQTADGWLVL